MEILSKGARMGDTSNGTNGNRRKSMAMGFGIVVTVAIAVMGWVLLAQSWAKDAGHELINMRVKAVEDVSSEQAGMMDRIALTVERMLANQEQFQKQLDRIERKLP